MTAHPSDAALCVEHHLENPGAGDWQAHGDMARPEPDAGLPAQVAGCSVPGAHVGILAELELAAP